MGSASTRGRSVIARAFLKQIDKRHESGEITEGQRKNYHDKWSVLRPLIGSVPVAQIDDEYLRELRSKRGAVKNHRGRVLSPSTLKKDQVFVLGVLKFAKTNLGSIREVPDAPSFEGKWSIQRRGRPFLTEPEYKTLHQLAKKQAEEPDLNPRTHRQRQELYWFILICVGGALRVGEAESVRWCDCELTTLTLPDKTTLEAVRMQVLGKHSRGGQREDAYVLYGGVFAFKQMLAAKPDGTKDEDPIFTESHREGMKRLLKDAKLYAYRDPQTGLMLTRDRKSLRPTGITLRLEKGDNVSYRDVARWARTSVQMVADFYDQAHPEQSAARVAGFKKA